MHRPFRRTFDIFLGADRDALWIEAVEGLDEAQKRIREIAAESPDDYFIFDTRARQIVDRISRAEIQAVKDGKSARGGGG
jgi:hypothetical protein